MKVPFAIGAGVRRQLVAIVWMIGGSSLMFALLLIMNEYIAAPRPAGQTVSTAFEVARPKPKQDKKRRKPQRQRRKRESRRAPQPMAPRLGASLAGMDFGLPAFDASRIGSVTDEVLGSMQDVVMTEDSVDTAPMPRKRGGVEYPKQARAKGIEGYVTLSMLIGTGGDVERVKILEAQPAGVFDEAAVRAVKTWRFDPAMYQGQPVKIWARQTVRFDLR